MDFENLVTIVRGVLAEQAKMDTVRDMPLSTSLRDDIGLDSMATLTFLIVLEDVIDDFSIDANTLEAEHVETIGSVCNYVCERLGLPVS